MLIQVHMQVATSTYNSRVCMTQPTVDERLISSAATATI
jgi:hypothetical protein